jgi:hypothetical protein
MPDKYFLDTNILIYAHDRSAGLKYERARDLVERLWISGQGVLSTQVLQELCINLRRKIARPLPEEEVRRIIQDYLSWGGRGQYSGVNLAGAGNRGALQHLFLGCSCSASSRELRRGGSLL